MTIRNLKNCMHAGGDDIARFPVETKERNRNCFSLVKKKNKQGRRCLFLPVLVFGFVFMYISDVYIIHNILL